jgi:hypothetical protein
MAEEFEEFGAAPRTGTPPAYYDLPSAGTKLSMKVAGPYAESVITDIPGCTDISWDGFKRGVRNPTNLQSLVVQKKPGMPDIGQLKGKVFYNPNNVVHQVIVNKLLESAASASSEIDEFVLTYADGFSVPSNIHFNGFISEFGQSATDPETGSLTADLTIELYAIIGMSYGTGTWPA